MERVRGCIRFNFLNLCLGLGLIAVLSDQMICCEQPKVETQLAELQIIEQVQLAASQSRTLTRGPVTAGCHRDDDTIHIASVDSPSCLVLKH